MTHTYASYRIPTSEQNTYIDWKWRAGNKYSKQTDGGGGTGKNTHIGQNKIQKKGHKKGPEGHFIILKGRIHQEDRNIINIYAPQHRSTQIHKENLGGLQERYWQQHNYSRGFSAPLSKTDRSKQNIKKDIVALNNALDEMDLTDIYIEPFIQKKQNTHSFQRYMGHFQR